MDKTQLREIVISTLALAVIAGGVTAALAGTNALTADTIAQRTAQTENQARQQVIDADTFEKHSLEDGTEYYTALRDGQPAGYVFTVTTTGKSAGLTVMTGIGVDGVITGVQVTDDNETAGYVDKVVKGGLLDAFQGKEAQPFTIGGNVDGVSQATKTSKGIADGVSQAVALYRQVTEGSGN